MEKQGFIYIWLDKKRKMYYVGCHFGLENDGYICSSNRMRDAYRRRPEDFRRKIIQKNLQKESLLEEEHKWLSLIPDEQLGKKYYNLSKKHFGHWSANIEKNASVREKLKGNKNRFGKSKSQEEIEKIRNTLTGRKRSSESIEKQRRSLLGKKQKPESVAKRNATNTGKKRTGQALINMQKAAEKMRIARAAKNQYKGINNGAGR